MPKRKDGMTREDIKARHTLHRELAKAVRDVRRGTKWGSIQGGLYRASGGWFVTAKPSVHMKPGVSTVAIDAKPMAIDPVFWEIFSPDTADAPLSYRSNGAWTCWPPEFWTGDLPEAGGAGAMAAKILEVADLQLQMIETTLTTEKFLQTCTERSGDNGSYQSSVICTLIALHRHAEALEVARHGQSQGLSGGFGKPGKSFNDLAVEWLTTAAAAKH
jgi:hypothetical protein